MSLLSAFILKAQVQFMFSLSMATYDTTWLVPGETEAENSELEFWPSSWKKLKQRLFWCYLVHEIHQKILTVVNKQRAYVNQKANLIGNFECIA